MIELKNLDIPNQQSQKKKEQEDDNLSRCSSREEPRLLKPHPKPSIWTRLGIFFKRNTKSDSL